MSTENTNSLALILGFSPPASADESTLQELTLEFYQKILEELCRRGNLHSSLWICSWYFDWLITQKQKMFFALLENLLESGCLEVLSGLAYEPQAELLTDDYASLHLKHDQKAIEKKFGHSPSTMLTLESSACPAILQAAHQSNLKGLLLPSSALNTAATIERQTEEPSQFISSPYHVVPGRGAGLLPRACLETVLTASKDSSIYFMPVEGFGEGKTEERAAWYEHFLSLASKSERIRSRKASQLLEELNALITPLDRLVVRTTAMEQDPSTAAIYDRTKLLQSEFLPIYNQALAAPVLPFAEDRYAEAIQGLLQSHCAEHYNRELLSSYRLRRRAHASILAAQVAIDSIKNPESDPVEGWVRLLSDESDPQKDDDLIVDTQLMRLFFDRQRGGIKHFEYRPRNLDLLNLPLEHQDKLSCIESLCAVSGNTPPPSYIESECGNAQTSVPLVNPGIITLRTQREVEHEGYQAQIVRQLKVKAGIGAHLNNSTTGFQMEYWLEADVPPPEGLVVVSEWFFSLSTDNPQGHSTKALLAVGGVVEHPEGLEDAFHYQSKKLPGGAYGLRMIDGVEKLVFDLRSAKPLISVGTEPLVTGEPGYRLYFVIDASRIHSDAKANTLFLSIV